MRANIFHLLTSVRLIRVPNPHSAVIFWNRSLIMNVTMIHVFLLWTVIKQYNECSCATVNRTGLFCHFFLSQNKKSVGFDRIIHCAAIGNTRTVLVPTRNRNKKSCLSNTTKNHLTLAPAIRSINAYAKKAPMANCFCENGIIESNRDFNAMGKNLSALISNAELEFYSNCELHNGSATTTTKKPGCKAGHSFHHWPDILYVLYAVFRVHHDFELCAPVASNKFPLLTNIWISRVEVNVWEREMRHWVHGKALVMYTHKLFSKARFTPVRESHLCI